MKIKTQHGFPPIPDRRFDWNAIDDDSYDGESSPIGYGPTERDAVEDLMEMIFENDSKSFIRTVTDTHMRILDRERAEVQLRQSPYRFLQHKLTDDEFDDDMFSQENGDGPVY